MCNTKAGCLQNISSKKPVVGELEYILLLIKSKGGEKNGEMRGTNILTDERNKCFCCMRCAEVSHTPNYDITVGVMVAAVAFVN